MANIPKTINLLPNASLPLAGNEYVPIWQDGTKKVELAELGSVKSVNNISPSGSDGNISLHAHDIPTDNSSFDNILSPSDDTIQKALDTLDHAVVTAGGGAVWGGISGTISNQSDLQNALNSKLNTAVSSNFAQTNHGHSVVVQGAILATSGSQLTLSVPSQTIQPVAVGAGNGAYNFSTLSFYNINGVSFGTNQVNGSNVITASYTQNVQTVQSANIIAGGNVTGTASSNYTLSEINYRGAGNVSVGNSQGSIIISATQSVQTQGTFALNNSSGNISVTVGSNMSFQTGANAITIGLDPNYSSHTHSQYLPTSNSYISQNYTSHTHSQYLNTSNSYLSQNYSSHTHSDYINTSISSSFAVNANTTLFQQTSNMTLYAAVSAIDGGTP